MTLTSEKIAPLVGKTVTVTRNDIPGSWTGVLEGYWDDGFLRMVKRDGVREVIHENHIEVIHLLSKEEASPPNTVKAAPTPARYQWSYKGVSFDFYRLCEILGVTHHAQAHALKKVIRAGRSVKSLEQDIEEAIACLERWKGMVLEDKVCQE